MDNDVTKLIDFLETQKKELQPDREMINYVAITISAFVDRYYSKDSTYKEKIKDISSRNTVSKIIFGETSPFGDTLKSLKTELEIVIVSIVNEIHYFGLPSKKDLKIDKSINVNVNQKQSQQQSSEINIFLESIKDELTGKQYKELFEIAQDEHDPKVAKPKILEKIKSFGEKVSSSIIANIITNPAIWSGLIG